MLEAPIPVPVAGPPVALALVVLRVGGVPALPVVPTMAAPVATAAMLLELPRFVVPAG